MARESEPRLARLVTLLDSSQWQEFRARLRPTNSCDNYSLYIYTSQQRPAFPLLLFSFVQLFTLILCAWASIHLYKRTRRSIYLFPCTLDSGLSSLDPRELPYLFTYSWSLSTRTATKPHQLTFRPNMCHVQYNYTIKIIIALMILDTRGCRSACNVSRGRRKNARSAMRSRVWLTASVWARQRLRDSCGKLQV